MTVCLHFRIYLRDIHAFPFLYIFTADPVRPLFRMQCIA